MNLILGLFTFILVVISVFMVLVILAQRAKDGGVGAALGGGAAEAAFGAESGNILSRATTYAAIAFFLIAFGLYLGHIHVHRAELKEAPAGLPSSPELISAPAEGADAGVDGAGSLDMPSITFPAPAGVESDTETGSGAASGSLTATDPAATIPESSAADAADSAAKEPVTP